MTSSVSTALKARIKDTRAEPVLRWLVKRSRGIRMPFDLVKNEIYDRQAVEVMGRVLSQDSNCVDVGSHQGQFLRDFMKFSPMGQHWAFEPIPQLAARLRTKFPSVRVLEAALSDRAGTASFFVVPDAPARSGLHRRDSIGHGTRQEIKVRTMKLDALIPTDARVDFIKMDVEGAEGLVIAGGLDAIARNRPFIVFEHGKKSSLDFGVTSEDIYDALVKHCGLRISLLADWLCARPSLTKDGFVGAGEWYFLAHPAR